MDETTRLHLKTLYNGVDNLLEWSRDVARSLEDVCQSIRESGLTLPPSLDTKIGDLESVLGQSQVSDVAFAAFRETKATL